MVLVCKVFMRLLMELILHFTARRDSHEKHKSQSSALTSAVCVCAAVFPLISEAALVDFDSSEVLLPLDTFTSLQLTRSKPASQSPPVHEHYYSIQHCTT